MFKFIAIFIASIVGIVLGQPYGPLNQLQNAFFVDEKYIDVLHTHFLFIGLSTSIFAVATALLLKAKVTHAAIIVFVSGILFVIFAQISEPNPFDLLLENTTEFLTYYLITALPVLGLFFGINRWRTGNTSHDA